MYELMIGIYAVRAIGLKLGYSSNEKHETIFSVLELEKEFVRSSRSHEC